jgi:hypothetical protein
MGSQGTFLKSMGILIFFNLIAFILGYLPSLFNINSFIGVFIIIIPFVVVAALASFLVPDMPQTIRWIASLGILTGILVKIDLPVVGEIGIGLCTNMMTLGVADINNISCLVYYFFLIIGLIASVSGVMSMNSGGE